MKDNCEFELIREKWDKKAYKEFTEYLNSLAEEKFRKFTSGLIPDDTKVILGIRIPELRKIAKEILKGDHRGFISCKKNTCHEEAIIDGLVRAGIKCGYVEMMALEKGFCKNISNWAICDTVKFKGMEKYTDELMGDIGEFIYNADPWFVRFGLKQLMDLCLKDEYIDKVLYLTSTVHSDFYYIEMMQAWLIATAAAKYSQKTFIFLENASLSENVLKKTVQKMRESYRISATDKKRASDLLK